MAIQHLVARGDQFNARPIGHQLRRDVTPEECYQCESAYQYVRQMQKNEKLCAGDAFYDLYSICVGCIQDNVDSGSPRDYIEPNLGRYIDYCAQFTALTKWASMGTMSATSATLQSTRATSAEEPNGTIMDEASTTGRSIEQLETSIVATTNIIPRTTTEVARPEYSANSSSIPKKISSSSSKAWISGAVVPSVLFIAMAVAFAIWWRRRRRNKTPKTPKSPHVDDVAGTSHFDKPELDSQGIPRPRSKDEATTSTRTAAIDTSALRPVYEMPGNGAQGSLNRAELQGEAKGGTGQNCGSGAYYELPAVDATVYELPTKL